jgi:DNA (cytosine-5)-methyltransferase 1
MFTLQSGKHHGIADVAPSLSSRATAGGGLGTDFECDGGLIPSIAAPLIAGSFEQNSMAGRGTLGWSAGDAPLRPVKPQGDHQFIAYGIGSDAVDRSGEGAAGNATERSGLNIIAECQPSLRARANNAVAYGGDAGEDGTGRGTPLVPVSWTVSEHANGFAWTSDVAPTVQAFGGGDTNTQSGVLAFAENSRAELRLGGGDGQTAPQLVCGGGKAGQGYPAIVSGMAVRRLTPRECERLQGFPDDFSLITWRGKRAADGPRYRALGNSMAVPVVSWVLRRICEVEESVHDQKAA